MERQQRYFTNVTETELRQRIRTFRRQNLRGLTSGQMIDALMSVFDGAGPGQGYSYPHELREFPIGQRFYHVRRIPDDDVGPPWRSMQKVGDAWEPPNHLSRLGRVNKEGESVLYTAVGDPTLAMAECPNVHKDKFFSLMQYSARVPIKYCAIGVDRSFSMHPEDVGKVDMFFDFLDDTFGFEVGEGIEHLYRLSQAVAESFFNLPEQQAYVYAP